MFVKQLLSATLFLLVPLSSFGFRIDTAQNSCLFRRSCGGQIKSAAVCISRKKHVPLSYESIAASCPNLLKEQTNLLCCDAHSLDIISEAMANEKVQSILRGSDCEYNIRLLLCNVECSPTQTTFLNVEESQMTQNKEVRVQKLSATIPESFMYILYESCVSERESDDDEANPKGWFAHLENILNTLSLGYNISFVIWDDEEMEEETTTEEYNSTQSLLFDTINEDGHKAMDPNVFDFISKDTGIKRKRRQSSPSCLMSEICEDTAFGYIPCSSPGPTRKLADEKAVSILRDECPHLFPADGSQPDVCCSDAQLFSLQKVMAMSSVVMNVCPACFNNFRRLFCHLACAPNQNQFLEIAEQGINENGKNEVIGIKYYVDDDFAKGTYDSCKTVRRFNRTFEEIVCRLFSTSQCDYKLMYQFIGADNLRGGHAPYFIDFVFGKEAIQANGNTYQPALLQVDGCASSCSCQHCAEAC